MYSVLLHAPSWYPVTQTLTEEGSKQLDLTLSVDRIPDLDELRGLSQVNLGSSDEAFDEEDPLHTSVDGSEPYQIDGWSRFHKAATQCVSKCSILETLPSYAPEAERGQASNDANSHLSSFMNLYHKDTHDSPAIKKSLMLGLLGADVVPLSQDLVDTAREIAGMISEHTSADHVPTLTEIWNIAMEEGHQSVLTAIACAAQRKEADPEGITQVASDVRDVMTRLQEDLRRTSLETHSASSSHRKTSDADAGDLFRQCLDKNSSCGQNLG